MLFVPGQILDEKYRIVRTIGAGGMGAVYEGENLLIRRRVAIKVLNVPSFGSTDAILRFEREAQAAGEIGNDHILEVFDLGALDSGDRYMVMEYLDGETLAERIERCGKLTPSELVPLANQFLSGLAAAHAAGIIHRDLKPENVFIIGSKAGRSDFVKIIDFGISKFSRTGGTPLHLTRTGTVMGTPCYMSPEQARGSTEADIRSDIYAVGVILYEAVTGRLPFDSLNFNDLMFKIALSDPPLPSSHVPHLDRHFETIIRKAMSREPDERFQSVDELSLALTVWSSGSAASASGATLDGVSPPSPASNPNPIDAPLAAPRRRTLSVALGAAVALAVLAITFAGMRASGNAKPDVPPDVPKRTSEKTEGFEPNAATSASHDSPNAPSSGVALVTNVANAVNPDKSEVSLDGGSRVRIPAATSTAPSTKRVGKPPRAAGARPSSADKTKGLDFGY